jgi:hypothetical protein
MAVPTLTLGVKSLIPKFVPEREMAAPPEVGKFSAVACDIAGASKLNVAARVPIWEFSSAATL